MLGGDISNKQAPIIAFNIDNLLFSREIKQTSIFNKIKDKLINANDEYRNKEVDKSFVDRVNNIWINHNYSIYFITFTNNFDSLTSIIAENSISYTSILKKDNWKDLRDECNSRFIYYFDNDEELLSYLSAGNALHIKELSNIIK